MSDGPPLNIVGTWKIVSATKTDDHGHSEDAFGPNPLGFITYTADGRMSAIVTSRARKPLSVPDSAAAPAAERAEAFATMASYAGRYALAGDQVTHHVEVSWVPNFVNEDAVRFVHLDGNRMTLRTTPFLFQGAQVVFTIVWERIDP